MNLLSAFLFITLLFSATIAQEDQEKPCLKRKKMTLAKAAAGLALVGGIGAGIHYRQPIKSKAQAAYENVKSKLRQPIKSKSQTAYENFRSKLPNKLPCPWKKQSTN